MNAKGIHIAWSISLLIIGIATLLLVGADLIAIELPDMITRILGVMDGISLPVLIFTTVKKAKKQTD